MDCDQGGEAEGGGAAEVGFHFDNVMDYGDLARNEIRRRAVVYFGWCVGLYLAALVIGLLPAVLVFLVGYMRFDGKESWPTTLAIALPVWGLCYLLFHLTLNVPWPQALLGDWFPALRSIASLALV